MRVGYYVNVDGGELRIVKFLFEVHAFIVMQGDLMCVNAG